MKLSAIKALIWELIFRSRWEFLGAAILAPLLASSLLYLETHIPALAAITRFIPMLMMVSALFLVINFCYAEFNKAQFEQGFPKHVLLLPLPTWLLAAVPMVFGTLFLFLYLIVWLNFILDVAVVGLSWFDVLLTTALAISWLQYTAWALSNKPLRAALMLISIVVATVFCLLSITAPQPMIANAFSYSILILLLIIGIIAAFAAVKRVRINRNEQSSFNWGHINFSLISFTKPFKDAFVSQFWYEFRLFGWLLPAFALAIGGLNFILIYFIQDNDKSLTSIILTSASLVYLSAISGFSYAKSYLGDRSHQMTTFWATRPLSSVDLAYAKLGMVGTSIGLALLISFGLNSLMLLIIPDSNPLAELWQSTLAEYGAVHITAFSVLLLIFIFLICWLASSLGLTLFLMGRKRLNLSVSAIFVAVFVSLALASTNDDLVEIAKPFLMQFGLLIVALPCLAAIITMAILSDHFKRLASLARLKYPTLVMTLLLVLSLPGIWSFHLQTPAQWAFTGVIATLVIMGMLPFIAAPISLSKNRHR